MSIISLTFQLHCPMLDAANFQQNNQTCYQPLFAFLERNVQKYPNFCATLIISGLWLDQAEKYDPELITRLKKLIASHKIELVASPYYHSLAFFYDPAEFEAEVWLCQERFRELFNIECSTFAYTDLIYNDQIGQWAATNGFNNILIGASSQILGRYSANHLYDIADNNTPAKLICYHPKLSSLIMFNFAGLRHAKTDDSVQHFNKLIDKATLWGNLINLVLDTEIFRQYRTAGIIQFFDALILAWLQNPHYQLVNLANLTQFDDTRIALSIKNTTSYWDELIKTRPHHQFGLTRSQDLNFQPPNWLNTYQQNNLQQQLYQLKPQIFRTEDEDLINDFCTKTSIDYLYDNSSSYIMRSWINETRNRRPLPQNLTQAMSELTERLATWQAQQHTHAITPQVIKATQNKAPQSREDDNSVTVNFIKNDTTKNSTSNTVSNIQEDSIDNTIQEAATKITNEATETSQTRSSRQIRWKLVIE